MDTTSYEDADITLAGVTLTLAEWEGMDTEAKEVLLAIALGGEPDADGLVELRRGVEVAAMADLLMLMGDGEFGY